MMYAFIDESGDHNLDFVRTDNVYNVFVLGTVLVSKEDYVALDEEFRAFKKSFFGGEDFIVHTKELTRGDNPRSDPRNKIMGIPERRVEFYTWMNDFFERAPLTAFFSVVNKLPFSTKYVNPFDIYGMSLENSLNRTLYYGKGDDIEIYPECRNSVLDNVMKAEFAKYSIAGTKFHTAEEIGRRIKKFEFKDKKANMSGQQFADLLVSPVGRHFLGIRPKPPGNEITYEVVRSKLAGSLKVCMTVLP